MILAATTVCSVDPVSQSAILGYHQSALVCILVCLIKFQGQDEKGPPNRSCCTAPGNRGSACSDRRAHHYHQAVQTPVCAWEGLVTLQEFLIASLIFAFLIAVGSWGLILMPPPPPYCYGVTC